MERSTNALSELAERLNSIMPYVQVECGVCELDKHLTSKRARDFIVAAQRIIAELAWACDNGNEGRPWMDVAQQTIMRCRAIAEEGSGK